MTSSLLYDCERAGGRLVIRPGQPEGMTSSSKPLRRNPAGFREARRGSVGFSQPGGRVDCGRNGGSVTWDLADGGGKVPSPSCSKAAISFLELRTPQPKSERASLAGDGFGLNSVSTAREWTARVVARASLPQTTARSQHR